MAKLTNVERARRASGMTQTAAAAITHMAVPTFCRKEKEPGRMTLDEFFGLYRELDSESKALMWAQLEAMAE